MLVQRMQGDGELALYTFVVFLRSLDNLWEQGRFGSPVRQRRERFGGEGWCGLMKMFVTSQGR